MKKKMRIAALLTTGLLALTPCVMASTTAFADTDDSAPDSTTSSYAINIKEPNNKDAISGYEYNAYQIFSGKLSTKTEGSDSVLVLSDIDWGTGFNGTGFLTALKGDTAFGAGEANLFKDCTNAAEVADVLKSTAMSGTDKLVAFAKQAKNFVGPATGTTDGPESDNKSYKISVANPGYYLIEETAAPKANEDNPDPVAYSRFMLDVVGEANVITKRDYPTLDKKITGDTAKDNGKANAVNIGDSVPYELTSTVPDMTGYDKYFFIVNDDLATGLTFNNDVKVYVDNVEIKNTTDKTYFTVQTGETAADVATYADGHSFQIVFNDFYTNFKGQAGKDIKITYSATLNEKADTTTVGNLNTVDLTYSNNPNIKSDGNPESPNEPDNDDPTGTTPPSKTKTYAANLKILKVDENKAELAGAKFQLKGTSDKVILINGTSYEKYTGTDTEDIYYMLTDGTFTTTAPTEGAENPKYEKNATGGYDKYKKVSGVTKETEKENICTEAYVDEHGVLVFNGLGAGTYTITELVAPEGYNMLAGPITFTLEDGNHSFTDGPVWTITGNDDVTMDADKVTAKIQIENKPGSTLPSTGGIGTKLFYLFGGMLAIGSGVILVTKKRMANTEK